MLGEAVTVERTVEEGGEKPWKVSLGDGSCDPK